jgi:hypothetical protein
LCPPWGKSGHLGAGDVKCQGAALKPARRSAEPGGDVAGLYAAGAMFGGGFIWTGINRLDHGANRVRANGATRRVLWLAAPGASVIELSDNRNSWGRLDKIDVRD